MANTYRWFKIGEANAEIERLESALVESNSKVEAASSNDSEIANQATALKQERDTLKTEVDSLKKQVSTLTADIDKVRGEAKAATDKISDFEAKVKTAASKEAVTIVASQGVSAPLKSEPSENPAVEKPKAVNRQEARQAQLLENIRAVKKASGIS